LEILAFQKKSLSNYLFIYKLQFHSSSIDLEKFHAEHVDRKSLPSDYNGVCASIEELHKQHINELSNMRDYFNAEEKQVYENN
jgi:hypothetical protein